MYMHIYIYIYIEYIYIYICIYYIHMCSLKIPIISVVSLSLSSFAKPRDLRLEGAAARLERGGGLLPLSRGLLQTGVISYSTILY